MNGHDEKTERVNHLELVLGYSSQYLRRRLNKDSGAGANAGSRIDRTFVAPNPLSELVWSPQKGLSLKCADSSFSDTKPSQLWAAGPSNVVSGSSSDKLIAEENFMTPLAAFDVRRSVTGTENSTSFPASDVGILPLGGSSHECKTASNNQVDDLETAVVGVTFLQKKEELANDKREVMYYPINLQVDGASRTIENKFSGSPDQLKLDVAEKDTNYEEPIVGLGTEAYDTEMHNTASLGKGHDELPSFVINESRNMVPSVLPGNCTLEKLESTDENGLQTPLSENACGLASKIQSPHSTNEIESNSLHDDGLLLGDKSLVVKPSPTNNRIRRYLMKGKAKALSDGNANGRTLNEDDGSHESVESCNSAGLLSTGKQQCSLDSQLIVGSKIAKKQHPESPSFSYFVKHESSFLNWISNMMKGFLKPNEGEAPCLALAVAKPGNEHEINDQNLITCNKNQDPTRTTMGFQSIFRSLYCPKRKGRESAAPNADYLKEEPKEPDLHNKICNINATPITCHKVTGHVYKQLLLSNEKFNESTYDSREGMTVQHKDATMDSAAQQEINGSNSAEYTGTSMNSSLGKRKRNSTEKIDSELPSEGEVAHNFGYKSDPLSSLWITRFTPKTSTSMSNKVFCNKSAAESLDCTPDVMSQEPQLQDHQGSLDGNKIVEGRETATENPVFVQNCATHTVPSFGFCKVKGHIDEKSKLSPIVPFPRTKNSEAMASVFAKRLDALKHMASIMVVTTITCFFCGVKGHSLQDCSKITSAELEEFLRNINSYEGTEESSCICIKCFQPNHWAVACPNTSSRAWYQAERGSSLVDKCGPGKMEHNARNEENQKLADDRASQLQSACAPDPRMKQGLELNPKSDEATSPGKIELNVTSIKKGIVSRSSETTVKQNLITPLCNFVNSQTSDIPQGIFDAVKGLRLSRTDILKWMNSQLPLSHLDGFFLRLRLSKWEEGLSGTGYYVASINGVQRESLTRKPKRSIAVTVGRIKCFVESPFVSNHDFLEDEIMAWWSGTLRSGGKIPSEEDLRVKAKEKKMLGF